MTETASTSGRGRPSRCGESARATNQPVECETLALGWLSVRSVERDDGTTMNTEEHVELPPTEGVVTFGVLGPFEIRNGEHAVLLKGRKQRALLALLALRAGELVPKDVLVEE